MWIRACLIALVLLTVLGSTGDRIGCYVGLTQPPLVALPQPEAPLNTVDRFILRLMLSGHDKPEKPNSPPAA